MRVLESRSAVKESSGPQGSRIAKSKHQTRILEHSLQSEEDLQGRMTFL